MGISAPLASAFKAKKGFGLYGRPPCLPKTKINGKANKNKKSLPAGSRQLTPAEKQKHMLGWKASGQQNQSEAVLRQRRGLVQSPQTD